MRIGVHVKYPLFLFVFMNFEFPHRFSKNTQISNLMKLRPLEAELLRANRQTDRQIDRQTDRQIDRQTDMTKLIVAYRNFANSPKEHSDISSHRVDVV